MDLAVVALVVSVVSAVAVVASAVFFHRQARAARQSADTASLQTAAEMVQRLDRVFVDHPALWAVFFDGEPADSLDPVDRSRLTPVAEAYLSMWEFLVNVPGWRLAGSHERWRELAIKDFVSSPLLREHMRDRADVYPAALTELMLEAEARVARRSAGDAGAAVSPPARSASTPS